MSTLVVTYQTRPEVADQNQTLVEAVFEQLRDFAPDGITYTCLRLDDDTFIHIADVDPGQNPLLSLDAFVAFSGAVAERCQPETGPLARSARIVGRYSAVR